MAASLVSIGMRGTIRMDTGLCGIRHAVSIKLVELTKCYTAAWLGSTHSEPCSKAENRIGTARIDLGRLRSDRL
jgi:hypothetical protein